MLAVIVDHFRVFSTPLVYLTGRGELWTSAAEMFFLLSGITLGIVRGRTIKEEFAQTSKRIWQRAGKLYLAHIAVVLISLGLAYLLAHYHVAFQSPGSLPVGPWTSTLTSILSLRYVYGWADFLMYYAVIMLGAPFALRLLQSRWWTSVLLVTVSLYCLTVFPAVREHPYLYFLVWQLYFFLGLIIARFRVPIIRTVYRQARATKATIAGSILFISGAIAALSNVLTFRPEYLPQLVPWADFWMRNQRSGLLRPAVAILTLAAGYVLYQMLKPWLLRFSGWFVNPIGQNSLYVFIMQALLIPPLSGVPLEDTLITSIILNALLMGTIWLMVKRRFLFRLIPR